MFFKPQEELESYLDGISFSLITEEQQTFLDSTITLEVLGETMDSLQNHKSPGIDGLPIEVFKENRDVLLPELLSVLEDALRVGILPDSMRKATIIVILKPDKDPLMVESDRPISLLTVDIKILAKVLARRLIRVITFDS